MSVLSHQRPLPALAVVLSFAMSAYASAVSYCPSGATNVCFAVGVPSSTASSGSGNIYFSISAPTSYEWVALGTGSMMSGSNMFVMYQDGKGNVTLSPRQGTAHTPPSQDTSAKAAKLTLLAGSGVSGTTMTANVLCSNCESWGTSGTLSVTSTNSPWIGAWKSGSSLATTNKNAALSIHDNTAQYKLDLTKATITSDSNPFVTSTASSSGSTSTGGTNSGGSGSTSGDGSTSSGGGGAVVAGSSSPKAAILIAHAVIMAVVMVILYPLGSALMPLVGKWLVHGVWQGLAYLLMWAGFSLGVVTAQQRGLLYTSQGRNHTIIGTFVVAAMGIQPFLGVLHHRHFVQNQSRGLVSHVHIWCGRLLMALGIINGGLGLRLSKASQPQIIGYSVAAAVLFLIYVAAKVAGSCWLAPRRAKRDLGRGTSLSLDGRRLDERDAGPQMEYRQEPQGGRRQERRRKGSEAGIASTHYSNENRSNSNDNGYSSTSPVIQPTRSAQRPPPPDRADGEGDSQYRDRMQREERRYAY